MIMCLGPHNLNNIPVMIKPWTSKFNFNDEVLKTVPLWIKLLNLSFNCRTANALSKIGSSLGQPIYVDECTIQSSRISFARILVEVDITRYLSHSTKVKDPTGKLFDQEVWYGMIGSLSII